MSTDTEWTPLADALDQLEAVIREQEPLPDNPSPYRRRAWAASCRDWAQKIIDHNWRTGCLTIRATTFRKLPDDDATEHVVSHNREIPPEFGEWAFFDWDTSKLAQRGSRRDAAGEWQERLFAEADGIVVKRADLDEWLAYMRSKIDPAPAAAGLPQSERPPPSVGAVREFVLSVADGSRTKPELKKMAEEHFGRSIPDHSRWRPATENLPDGALIKPGYRRRSQNT